MIGFPIKSMYTKKGTQKAAENGQCTQCVLSRWQLSYKLKRSPSFLKERVKQIPMQRMAKKDEISNHIINLIDEKNSFMTGQTITVAGGE